MKRIKVMHIVHNLEAGGAQNGIINLANNIDKGIFDISICSLVGTNQHSKFANRCRVALFELDKKSGNDITLPFKLSKLCRRWRPHIIHTHAWGTLCEGLIGSKMAGIPSIIHGEHGTIQKRNINIYIQRLFWALTDQLLSVSESHRKAMSDIVGYPISKIRVIKNGVDLEKYASCKRQREITRNQLRIKQADVVIGTVGRLFPVKNQAMLIKAFAILASCVPDVRLVIVGDGPLKNELMELKNCLEMNSRVIFLGARSDIPELLNAFDIFALPSLNEGMPNTILEAMSSGLAVVATDVGGNSEIVKNNMTGLLVSSDNIEEFSAALMHLVKNPQRRRHLGQVARKQIEQEFSLRSMVLKYERLYLESYQRKYLQKV
jgi:sugar transferase (PEP-CTERM/EpsH1 system associated)